MKAEYKPFVDELIELCIKEDIGDGDHTSLSCIPSDEHGRMRLLCKQEGIIAGIEIAQVVFHRLDPEMEFEQVLSDGDRVKPGEWRSTSRDACARCCRPNASSSTSCSA